MAEILVTGGKGYLGSRVVDYFGDRAVGADVDEVDISSYESVRACLTKYQPKIVINMAALTDTHGMEKPEARDAAFRVNVQGPANIAQVCQVIGARMVHISTGMVFPDWVGPDGIGFAETDPVKPVSWYAWTKVWSEGELMPLIDEGTLIIRIHLPISRQQHPKNLLNKLQRFDTALDAQNSMTMVEDLLIALEKLIAQKAAGVYHVVNPGSISFFDIAMMMKEKGLIPGEKEVRRVTKEEFDEQIAAKGGAKQTQVVLNTDKLREAGVVLPNIHEAVANALQGMGAL